MRNILVTGGAGFIGYHLAKRLAAGGDRVTIVDNLSRGRADGDMAALLESESVEFIQADLTDPRVFISMRKDYNYIYHFAAIIGVRNVIQHPDRVLYVNATSTLNLLEFAKNIPALKRFFFSSTSEAYAGTQRKFGIDVPTAEDVALTVDDVGSERATYLLSKIYGESACLMYRKKHGMPVTIGRYHNVYGPRMGFLHVVPEMFVKITRNSIVEVASPRHTRAMCYVDDAVEMTVRACECEAAEGKILNIGNQHGEISVEDLVRTIARVIGREVSLKMLPDTRGSPTRRCPDISKITALTGYSPNVGLKEGLWKTYSWYSDKLNDRCE